MTIRLIHGDALGMLATLPAASVQTVVTSPPFYRLRRYTDDAREIGQEETPALYAAALVAVFRELRRVLRDDGTAWLNLGDSYAMNGTPGMSNLAELGKRYAGGGHKRDDVEKPARSAPAGIAPKNLLGIPWRVAFALQDDGWYLRSDIIWSKPNPMPESVTDRPTRNHEYLFLLSKQPRYYYDAAAIAEPSTGQTGAAANFKRTTKDHVIPHQTAAQHRLDRAPTEDTGTRNRRTVWNIATQPYSGAHFATMPEALVAPCILAGSSARACEHCGAAWGRVTAQTGEIQDRWSATNGHAELGGTHTERTTRRVMSTIGSTPRCACPDNTGSARSTVLDPFAGSGTVLRVAQRFQRNAIGIDLNADYLALQEQRNNGVQIEMDML